jgi:hypothetical protein
MYDLTKPAKFSGENYGVKTTVEFDHSDISLDEVFDAFETIVTGMGFHKDSWKQWILERADEYREDEPEFDSAGFSIEDREPHSHFVSNEEADEDYRASMLQDEQRYEDGKSKFNGVSQFILDFVEKQGTATFFDMNEAYRTFTNGSNSLSHIIKALLIPYKNRPTRRYLYKVKHGVYGVKIANPSNWVEANGDYRTFNEAPYNN